MWSLAPLNPLYRGLRLITGKAFGYTEAWTYTLPDEPGTSLRVVGEPEVEIVSARKVTP